jgi:hypothetical protein
MAERSIVFPEPEVLVGYARKAGLTLKHLWKIIETELVQRPRTRKFTIHGPKQTIIINLRRDSTKLKKKIFADAQLGRLDSHESQPNERVERSENADEGNEPSIGDIIDNSNVSDMSPAAKKGHNRTPWRLGEEKRIKPRYPIPELKPNVFDTEGSRERRKLWHEKWAKANRIHKWPSWLVNDYDNSLTGEVLDWMYPNISTSEEEKLNASITLEAVNVYLWGHKPCEDSPLYRMKEKTIAKRVQRFLKDAKRVFELLARIDEGEAGAHEAEAQAYLKESSEQAKGDGELERVNELEKNFGYGPEDELDDDDDYLVRLWRKRLNDEE